jgi:hypothetical protein
VASPLERFISKWMIWQDNFDKKTISDEPLFAPGGYPEGQEAPQ